MNAPAIPVSVELDRYASALFGDAWAARVAVLTGLNRRTVARVMAAGRAGLEHGQAAVVADRLADAVGLINRTARLQQARWRRIIAARASGPRVRQSSVAVDV